MITARIVITDEEPATNGTGSPVKKIEHNEKLCNAHALVYLRMTVGIGKSGVD